MIGVILLYNPFRVMKASQSEAILIPLAIAILQPAPPATDTVVLSCSESLAVGGEIAWHRGGALHLLCRRETWDSDQAVVKTGPGSLLA